MDDGKGSGMCMKVWDIQGTDDWSVSRFSNGDNGEEVSDPHCCIGVSDERVQRRVRWGKVGPKDLPYILSRS